MGNGCHNFGGLIGRSYRHGKALLRRKSARIRGRDGDRRGPRCYSLYRQGAARHRGSRHSPVGTDGAVAQRLAVRVVEEGRYV